VGESWRYAGKDEVIEGMMGKLTLIERRMFENRYMTWYARENADYMDPRLINDYQEYDGPPLAYPTSPSPLAGGAFLPHRQQSRSFVNAVRTVLGRRTKR
jgi:hypothetical protein